MARGHIRQRSKKNKDSYTVYIYLGVDQVTGRKKYKTEVVHTGKRDAEKRLTELLRQHDTGMYVEPPKETTAEFLEHWFHDYAETHVSLRTLEGYRGILDRHIIPAIGHIRLDKLTSRHIDSFESDSLRRGLSEQTVLHHHRLIFQALRWGVRMGTLARNVVEAVEPPRPKQYQARTLGWEEVYKFLQAAQPSGYYALFLIAILTGIRRSELLALRWRDLDMEAGTLAVSRGVVRLGTGEMVIGPPKSGKARMLHLPGEAMSCFKRMQEQVDDNTPQRDSLIFCRGDGTPLRPGTVSKAFSQLTKKAGLQGIRLHDLRHTHASLLLGEGVHLKVVSERLGHSGIAITADLYSHVMPGLQREAAMQLDKRMESLKVGGFTNDLHNGLTTHENPSS